MRFGLLRMVRTIIYVSSGEGETAGQIARGKRRQMCQTQGKGPKRMEMRDGVKMIAEAQWKGV